MGLLDFAQSAGGGGLIGAGLSWLGQKKANEMSRDMAREANVFSAAEAAKQRKFGAGETALNRQFQERMSSSAYQRSMADMKKAGLNPMLAFMKGGSSTPSGGAATSSSPSGQTSRFESTTAKSSQIIANLVPQVLQTLNTQAETAKKLAETTRTEAETQLTTEKQWLTFQQGAKIANEIHMQVPKVMEAQFQADLYEYVQDKLGVVPTNLTPGALIKFVQQNAAAFLIWRRSKGRKVTTKSMTIKHPKGSQTIKTVQ